MNDYAEILDDDSENQFESVLGELRTKAKIDFALAIVRSTNGKNIFDFSLEVAKDWKIGSENGGLLLVVAIDDRTWFIQIDKRLEQNLSNAEVKQIGDTMIPFFKDKKYADGLRKCVETMIESLAEKQKFDPVKF